MKKFTKWLIDNGFIITNEYSNITNTMEFYKNNIKYIIYPQYNSNKISWHDIYKDNRITGEFICSGKTQKELIEDFERYLNK